MKKLLAALLAAFALPAGAVVTSFVPGQTLSASSLNSAFAQAMPFTGGVFTGSVTIPTLTITGSVTVAGSPIPIASGGTNATTATGATSNLQYLQGATGSVARTLTQKFQDVINVNDFGADPTGVADSAAAISAAEASCPVNGCQIVFGTGTYKVGSTVTINKQGLWQGAGASTGGTYILTNSATADVFRVTNSSVYIRDMSFDSSVTRTGGSFILLDTTSSIVSIEDVYMLNWYYGIRLLSSGGPFYIRNATLKNGVVTNGQAIRIENGTDVTLDFVVVDNPPASKPHSCVTITASSDVSLINSQLQHCGNALELTPGANQVVSSVYAVNSFFDNSGTNGVLIQPLSGTASSVTRVRFVGCWFSSGTVGIAIDNSNTSGAGGIDGVEIIGAEMFLNTNGAVLNVQGAGNGHIDILGGKFAGNSNDAIQVFNVTTGLKIVGARIGPTGAIGANGLGIQIAGVAISNLLVSDNDVTGNTGAGYSNASTSTSKIVKGNLGFNPIASTAITVGASPFTYTNNTGDTVNVFVTGGTVSSVTLGGNTVATATNTVVPVPQGQSVVVTYTVAPTMTYVGY